MSSPPLSFLKFEHSDESLGTAATIQLNVFLNILRDLVIDWKPKPIHHEGFYSSGLDRPPRSLQVKALLCCP